ncbi:acyltransferase family protein [Angustibacter aerolatus]|nr:acyltransferase [Angustibacter aerolatus]
MRHTTAEPAGRPPSIAALTGLRAVAAVWVVLFHYRADVERLVPPARHLDPLLASGYLGVDVFFVLSGFVLAYNYGHRLDRWRPREARDFVQNRVARVWPVQVVTLHADLLYAAAVGALGVSADGHRRTPAAYVENLTMTHLWFSDRPSFNAPAWSISAEWLVYLLCPLLLLGFARVRRAGTALAGAAGLYAVMLLVFALFALPNGNVPHAGLLRVVVEFVAGVLLVRVHQQAPRGIGRAALPVAVALVLVVLLVPRSHGGGYWLAPAFALLVLLLAAGTGPLAAVLSTRWSVLWGEASYCLYMTHVLVQPLLRSVVHPLADGRGSAAGALVLVLDALVLGAVALLLRRAVEVPARGLLRARTRHAASAPRQPVGAPNG